MDLFTLRVFTIYFFNIIQIQQFRDPSTGDMPLVWTWCIGNNCRSLFIRIPSDIFFPVVRLWIVPTAVDLDRKEKFRWSPFLHNMIQPEKSPATTSFKTKASLIAWTPEFNG